MDVGSITKLQYLKIGAEGENDAIDIVIDVTDWIDELGERGYENPCFHILFKPYDQATPLTCDANTVFDRDAGTLTWTITQSITQYPGLGYTEIRALNHPDNGLLKKSKVIPTIVDSSITGADGGVIPAPYDDWVNSILALIDKLNNSLDQAMVFYALSDTPDAVPADPNFSPDVPDLEDVDNKGKFLWTRTDIHWSTGAVSHLLNISYIARDGDGPSTVSSVNGYTGPVRLDGDNLYRYIDRTPESRESLNSVIDQKLNSSMIVYTTDDQQPSNPVTGMIWLKKKA